MVKKRWLVRITLATTVVLAGALAVAAWAGTATYTSTDGPVTIADAVIGVPTHTPTAASPFPSVINVPPGAGTVSGVTVSLQGLTHTCPSDLHAVLFAPNGDSVVLIAHTGSCQDGLPTGDITFDDAAAASFTASNGVNPAGTWRPAQSALNESGTPCPWTGSLVSPAPAGPYGATMASVTGGPASGAWKLYIEDGCGGDVGAMASWSLSLTTTAAAPVHVNRAGYCAVAGNTWPSTGAAIPPGQFLDLELGQPDNDPHYTGAILSNYLEGVGITCGDTAGFVRTDQKVGVYTFYKKA